MRQAAEGKGERGKGLGQKLDDGYDYREVRLKNRVFSKRDARRASSMDTQKRSAISHRNALILANIISFFCESHSMGYTDPVSPIPQEAI
jgi:hypothetical protein